MKYPPVCSAHWEGAVGQWLRGQLDARGIDAPAYGRYVLSLLTRPLDPADLSPSPIGNKAWERRIQCDWPPVKVEALKRSAAVQCLQNASDDQNSGIEQLVDELCSRLKEVEKSNAQIGKREIQTMKPTRKERSRQLSPAEMARLYYAAFPALVPSATESMSTLPPSTSTTVSSHVHRNKDSFKLNVGNKDPPKPKKHVVKERRNTIHTNRSHNRSSKHKNHNHKVQLTEELPEWVNNGYEWDIESQETMLDALKGNSVDEGYGTCDNATIREDSSKRLYERDSEYHLNVDGDDIVLSNHWDIDETFKSMQKSPIEDESMAKFKAKFDPSLEALWRKEQNNNVDYEMPVDFHDISSPSDRMFDCYSADKPLPLSLTSSIWSNNESKFDWENNDIVSLNYIQSKKPEPAMMNMMNSEMKINIWQNNTEMYNKETMEVIYKKLKPLNLDDSEESFDFQKPSVSQINNSMFKWANNVEESFSFEMQSLPVGTPAHSFNILNHNSSCSSFTEVIPKVSTGFVGDSLKRKITTNMKIEQAMNKSMNNFDMEKEEEDLLTSMRTHFRPIKGDGNDISQTTVNYADGMTFSVVSDLDSVKFSRSDSGTMFLESDNEPPKQYMEYRKQGIDYSRLDICPSNCSDDDMCSTDLVLKFRVCQTEKYVQTDTADLMVFDKKESESMASDLKKFPSECSISSNVDLKKAQDVDSELETLSVEWVQCDECKMNNNQWETSNWHSFQLNSSKIWSSDDNFCKACSEQQAKVKNMKRNSEKSKIFEEESAKEWDEILSDLRYIQDIKSSDIDWQEDVTTPSDNCFIAPSEISFHAADGNFIKSALLAQKKETNVIEDVKAWLIGTNGKIESNTVGKILDQSLFMYSNVEPHCETCSESSSKVDDAEIGWRVDRKRRHSAVNNGRLRGVGKLRCTLPAITNSTRLLHMSFLPTADRPLTR